jgi:type 1 glutamine amidotransferase
MIGEDEYKTQETLPVFSRKYLERDFRVTMVYSAEKNKNDFPGLDVLRTADVALISVRRRPLPKDQLELIREFVASKKAIIGIRTASHAFAATKGAKLPEGLSEWTNFDEEVLGCKYTGHHSNKVPTVITLPPRDKSHPIDRGLIAPTESMPSWLYKVSPIASDAIVIASGKLKDNTAEEPVAWAWVRKDGGRSFYTTLGHPEEFKTDFLNTLLRNGTYWACGLKIPEPK